MPEKIKKAAEERLAELQEEFERLTRQVQRNRDLIASNDEKIQSNLDLIASNKARIEAYEKLAKTVEENRAQIEDLMKKSPAEFVKDEGTWKKALDNWAEQMRLFSQT